MCSKSWEERFWPKVQRSEDGSDGCWLWTPTRHGFGYGRFKIAGKVHLAHRLSWQIHNGDIPAGMQVLHRCDIPPCVRPSHLFLGTNLDNVRNKMAKGRAQAARGREQPRARLHEQDILEICALLEGGTPQRVVAKRYSVNRSTISRINSGILWAHVSQKRDRILLTPKHPLDDQLTEQFL